MVWSNIKISGIIVRQLNKRRPNPFSLLEDMVAKPAREQRTPRQSHSSWSYQETGMGGAERSHRDGGEFFVHEDSLPSLKSR